MGRLTNKILDEYSCRVYAFNGSFRNLKHQVIVANVEVLEGELAATTIKLSHKVCLVTNKAFHYQLEWLSIMLYLLREVSDQYKIYVINAVL